MFVDLCDCDVVGGIDGYYVEVVCDCLLVVMYGYGYVLCCVVVE